MIEENDIITEFNQEESSFDIDEFDEEYLETVYFCCFETLVYIRTFLLEHLPSVPLRLT